MSLSKQMMIAICLLFILVFIGTFTMTVNNSRQYFEEQLSSNAQDTATSLGLLLSNYDELPDKATLLSMVKAIFDRGFYNEIAIQTLDGKSIVSRKLKTPAAKAPPWFINLIHLESDERKAIIMQGWHQRGYVLVASNPVYAYDQLWKNTLGFALFYSILAFFSIICSIILIKIVFKPLKAVTKQADAICSKRFEVQKKLPKTFELKQVTSAMNTMVLKLKELFESQSNELEKMREHAYRDQVTSLGNRRYFLQKVSHFLAEEEEFSPGFLVMLELGNLNQFNNQHGYAKGNELIRHVSQLVQQQFSDDTTQFFSRLDGPSFALLYLSIDLSLLESKLKILCRDLTNNLMHYESNIFFNISVVNYSQGMDVSSLLAKGDIALQYAKDKGYGHYHFNVDLAQEKTLSTEEWKEQIIYAIEHKLFNFYHQAVKSNDALYHREIFVRMLDKDENEVAAGHFFPIAEKYGLGFELDRMLLSKLNEYSINAPVAINLSPSSLLDDSHREQLFKLLETIPSASRQFVSFELSERFAFTHAQVIKEPIEKMIKLGYRIGLDRVGLNFISLYQLMDMQVAYLKLDGSFSKGIETSKTKRQFIENLIRTANTLDITIIATNVENELQWQGLQALGVSCGQGWYFAKLLKYS